MRVKLAGVGDYFAFRKLLYAQLSEADENWFEDEREVHRHRLMLDDYIRLLKAQDEALLIFQEEEISFGFGRLTVASNGLIVYGAFFQAEFCESFTDFEVLVAVGKCISQFPNVISFDCHKHNIVYRNAPEKFFVSVSEDDALSKQVIKQAEFSAQDYEQLSELIDVVKDGERRDQNSDVEAQLHGYRDCGLSPRAQRFLGRVLNAKPVEE